MWNSMTGLYAPSGVRSLKYGLMVVMVVVGSRAELRSQAVGSSLSDSHPTSSLMNPRKHSPRDSDFRKDQVKPDVDNSGGWSWGGLGEGEEQSPAALSVPDSFWLPLNETQETGCGPGTLLRNSSLQGSRHVWL